ncbi:MAG: YfbM family protein [Planctomycetes bacterium]|nr:YfbM family protein [Planctomycetota bacterium]
MGCRGVHFALTPADTDALLSAADDDQVLGVIQEDVEERWEVEGLFESDKAWDAIHRCLTDGSLAADGSILGKCILGGRQLHKGSNHIVCFLDSSETRAVAEALKPIEEVWMRRRYDALASTEYDGPMGDEDFEYTWEYFDGLREFFRRAALDGRPVVFTVGQ